MIFNNLSKMNNRADNNGNMAKRSKILPVIILVINKSDALSRSSDFVNYLRQTGVTNSS